MTRDGMRFQRSRYAQVQPVGLKWVLLPLLGLLGCGGLPSEEPPPEPVSRSSTAALLPKVPDVTSLLAGNGLSTNGLSTNGLSTNGLSTNGLSTNGLTTPQFIGWFDQAPALSTQLLQYIARCALPAGASLQWTHPVTGVHYQWAGGLGLAPGWATGLPATELEQQVITACLAALTNKYGLNLPVSVLGLNAAGLRIPLAPDELTQFPVAEACFFGNLFKGEGLFAGNSALLSSVESSARACGLETPRPDGTTRCAPIQHVGRCHDKCTFDGTGPFFPTCFHNGKEYRALTTRLRREELYRCGDRVCQVSEACGTGLTPDNCSDCGPCPSP
jgi:hypothetical protein